MFFFINMLLVQMTAWCILADFSIHLSSDNSLCNWICIFLTISFLINVIMYYLIPKFISLYHYFSVWMIHRIFLVRMHVGQNNFLFRLHFWYFLPHLTQFPERLKMHHHDSQVIQMLLTFQLLCSKILRLSFVSYHNI